ncbi:hypothetical protein [Priestia megaterium]|uniref:hypothetical protein n=1 Tax=Priestia megaterium TaxID=1404 RepID=UPI001FB2288D|nr:hypothetical protein [Priestia megaterium]
MESNEIINSWYSNALGVNIAYAKLNWNERQRLDQLVKRQYELDEIKAKEAFAKLSAKEQRKRSLEARMFELAFEPMHRKEIRDVENETLERVLRNLKKLVKK